MQLCIYKCVYVNVNVCVYAERMQLNVVSLGATVFNLFSSNQIVLIDYI